VIRGVLEKLETRCCSYLGLHLPNHAIKRNLQSVISRLSPYSFIINVLPDPRRTGRVGRRCCAEPSAGCLPARVPQLPYATAAAAAGRHTEQSNLKSYKASQVGYKQCWGSGSGSISQRDGSGAFPFLIKVLSGLK
jgi:hypothetical protein